MKVIFVRHAAAIERDPVIAEERRFLTPKGRAFFRETSLTMLKAGIEPEVIITSPLLRAVQTADILAESLVYNGPLVAVDTLEPGFGLSGLEMLLRNYHKSRELVIVGHEPDLSGIIASLLCLPNGFAFKKGSAVRLSVDPAELRRGAVFKWLATGRKLITTQAEALA